MNTDLTFCYLMSPVLIAIRTDADAVGMRAASSCSAANDDKKTRPRAWTGVTAREPFSDEDRWDKVVVLCGVCEETQRERVC